MSFSHNSRWLATGSYDWTVRLWDMDLDALLQRAKRTAGRDFTVEESEQYRIAEIQADHDGEISHSDANGNTMREVPPDDDEPVQAAASGVGIHDWPVFGRDHTRNAVSPETEPPTDWDVDTGRNIKWKAEIASVAFGAPVVSDGLVWIGGNRWRPGEDASKDGALLLCFDEESGEKLYEYVSPRLDRNRIRTDPHFHGLGCSPLIEGDRLWFVTNRAETVCLDIAPLKAEPRSAPQIVWKVDMREEFGVYAKQPFMGPSRLCSIPPSYQGLIFVSTGNGVENPSTDVISPEAPGLICFDSETGEAKWQVVTGPNVLLSEVASPLVADIAGRGQVVMPHGDGWVRSWDPLTGDLLWDFDSNPKESTDSPQGRGNRNYFLSTPVLYEDRIYIANGDQPEHGGGVGRLGLYRSQGVGRYLVGTGR